MKALKIILISLGSLIVLLIVIGLFLPSKMHIERSLAVNAPASVVYAQLSDLRFFNKWSPWHDKDTTAEYTFSGPEKGIGQEMHWVSRNGKLGTGTMKITDLTPSSVVKMSLLFGPDNKATSDLVCMEKEGKTDVTWTFDADAGMNLFKRYMGLVMKPMVGGDFEQGLAKLKKVIESGAVPMPLNVDISMVDVKPQTILYVRMKTKDMSEIGPAFTKAYDELNAFMKKNNIEMTGPPVAITNEMTEKTWDFDAGFPIADKKVKTEGNIKLGTTPSGMSVKAVYTGPYENSMGAYQKAMDHVKAMNHTIRDRQWEQYLNDPKDTPKDKLVTVIYFPVK